MAEHSRNYLKQFHVENGITRDDFEKIWKNYDTDNSGYIEKGELELLTSDLLKSGDGQISSELLEKYKQYVIKLCDDDKDGRLNFKEASNLFVFKEPSSTTMPKQVFLGHFRTTTGIHSADFIKIWKKYDTDKNGYIESTELDNFLRDLMKENFKIGETDSLKDYKDKILKYYDTNNDGKLDLKEMFELLPVEENFLAKFKGPMTINNFNRVFAHYDKNNDQAISGDELIAFMKDFMESMGADVNIKAVESYTKQMIELLDKNKDNMFQKSELKDLLL